MIIEQLIDECSNNNTKAQEQVYRLLAPKLFSVCLKYSRNYEEAQDNLQESFLVIFEKIGQFKKTGSFEGWAKRIVINYVLQQYRKQNIFEIVSEKIADDEEIEIDDDIFYDLQNNLLGIKSNLEHYNNLNLKGLK